MGRRAAGVEILERDDHVKVALDLRHALAASESLQGFLYSLGRDAAAAHQFHKVTCQAEARNIGAGVGPEADHQLGGVLVECGHRLADLFQTTRIDPADLRAEGDHPRSQRFGQHEHVTGTGIGALDHLVHFDQAGYRQN